MDAIRNNWNRYRWSCIAGIGCAFIIGMLPLTDFLERWELRTHDLRFHLRCPRASHARIVIAEINEDTCKVWPEPVSFWGGHYAAIIRNAHRLNAKWIGLDILEKTSVDDYLEMLLLGMLQETKIGAKLSPTDLDKIDASAQLHPEREFARAMEEVGPCVILPYALSKEGVIEGEAASLP